MMKKLVWIIWAWVIWVSSLFAPMNMVVWDFTEQETSGIWVEWWDVWWTWDEGFIEFVRSAVNWVLGFLALITIIVIIFWGLQMVTAAWDDWKYKKWFTIVKQSAMWLILIWVSALIVNLIFNFVDQNAGWWGVNKLTTVLEKLE